MKTHFVSVTYVVVGLTLVAGCSTQPRRVDCDEQLQPINAPAPAVAQQPETKPSASNSIRQEPR
jgi:outer membrane murein-binding lipoprotein Lpp